MYNNLVDECCPISHLGQFFTNDTISKIEMFINNYDSMMDRYNSDKKKYSLDVRYLDTTLIKFFESYDINYIAISDIYHPGKYHIFLNNYKEKFLFDMFFGNYRQYTKESIHFIFRSMGWYIYEMPTPYTERFNLIQQMRNIVFETQMLGMGIPSWISYNNISPTDIYPANLINVMDADYIYFRYCEHYHSWLAMMIEIKMNKE